MARRTKRADGLMQKSFRVKVDGVTKQFVVYGHNEAELTKKEQAKRAEISRGLKKREEPSVQEYYDRWVIGRKDTVSEATLRIQDKTFGVMSNMTISDIANVRFGEIKMQKVDIDILRALQTELRNGRKTQTVNDYMALLKHIFTDALKERVIDYNPCLLLNNLKRTEEKARDTHHRALTVDEQKAFFECERCKNSFYYNVFRFAVCTGMRIGEIGALKYSDIRNDIIHIERTITRTAAGNYIVGENAKTEAGKRIFPLKCDNGVYSETGSRIKEIIASQKEINALLDGNTISIDNLLFKAPERGLLMSTPIDREIKRICKICGIEPFTMHALRATFIINCIMAGMQPKTLQTLVGHTHFDITYSLYGHCSIDTMSRDLQLVKCAI